VSRQCNDSSDWLQANTHLADCKYLRKMAWLAESACSDNNSRKSFAG